jgi:hypothetical protein
MEYFADYLQSHPFTLYSDHQMLEKLRHVQAKTLNCLQKAMQKFQFQIVNKKGSEMPADYLSWRIVSVIFWQNSQIKLEQENDSLISPL